MSDRDALAEVLAEHPDMTDRSSTDGCECGYPDPRTYEAHLADTILASDWLAAREAEAGARALEEVRRAIVTRIKVQAGVVYAADALNAVENMIAARARAADLRDEGEG